MFCSLLLLALISQVYGHGRLTTPPGRGTLRGNADYIENEPVALGPGFVCRNDPAPATSSFVNVQAGSPINLQWLFTAAHVGDCAAYITYDTNLPDNQKQWFKIWELYDCKARNQQNVAVTIPSYLPSCTHCILRWEWVALHVRPQIEYYTQCVDVVINGNANGGLPTPRFNIPGHLPTNGNEYRDAFNPGSPQFIAGPPIATYNGQQPTSQQQTSQQQTSQQQTSQQQTSQQTSQQQTSQQQTSQQQTSQQQTSQQQTSSQGSTDTSSINCPNGVQSGQTFPSPDGCNQCVCGSNGLAICTEIACEGSASILSYVSLFTLFLVLSSVF